MARKAKFQLPELNDANLVAAAKGLEDAISSHALSGFFSQTTIGKEDPGGKLKAIAAEAAEKGEFFGVEVCRQLEALSERTEWSDSHKSAVRVGKVTYAIGKTIDGKPCVSRVPDSSVLDLTPKRKRKAVEV